MTKTQYSYIQRKTAESGQTGTATYDLPERDFIEEIIVRAYSTPTASTNPALPLSDAITKIEIVDGSKVIQSLSGNQAMALSMFRGSHKMTMTGINDNAAEGYDDFHLILGGVFNGTRYAPDFSQFSNPQIKISWDYSQTTTKHGMSCDADSSPAMKFTVMAKVHREAEGISHGYVKSSEIKTWTSAASTETTVEIPRGEPLLGIMIEAGYDAKYWTDDINKIKLDFDNGAWVPLELYEEEIPTIQKAWFKDDFEVSWIADIKDNIELDVHMGYPTMVHFISATDAGRSFEYQAVHKGIETVGKWDLATPSAATSYESTYIKSVGQLPFQCWYLPIREILGGEADTLDTTKFSRIDLKITSGSSPSTSSTPAVVAEYLIT